MEDKNVFITVGAVGFIVILKIQSSTVTHNDNRVAIDFLEVSSSLLLVSSFFWLLVNSGKNAFIQNTNIITIDIHTTKIQTISRIHRKKQTGIPSTNNACQGEVYTI